MNIHHLHDAMFSTANITPEVETELHSNTAENAVEALEELAFRGATFSPQVLASLARSHNAIARLLEDVK